MLVHYIARKFQEIGRKVSANGFPIRIDAGKLKANW